MGSRRDTTVGDLPAAPGAGVANVLRIEGDYWTIAFAGQVIRVRDSKGLHYLAHLLRHPGVRVPAVELVALARQPIHAAVSAIAPAGDDEPDSRERARTAVTKGIKAAIRRIAAFHPALGQHLEATIRCGYACSYMPDPRVPIAWEP